MKRLRRYLVAGILVWAPLAVTFLLLRVAVNLMDKTLRIIPTFFVLVLTGMLAANFVGRYVVGGWESLLDRIPVVRSIYSAAKNFAEIVFSDSEHSFKRVLMIEYPRPGLYSLAFQTSSELGEVQGRTVIIVPKKDVVILDMEVDEALKMIISLGVVVPRWRKEQIGDLTLERPPEP